MYFSNTGSLTLTLSGNLQINCGGILATPFVTDTITGGSLQCDGNPKTLEVFDYGSLTINSRIVNVSGSKNNLIITGTGNTTLGNNSNGFTGNLVIDGGTTTVNSTVNSNVKLSTMGSATTSSRVITVNDGGTLYWSTNNASSGGSGPNASTAPTIRRPNGSTLFATNYNAIGNVQLKGGTLARIPGLRAVTRVTTCWARSRSTAPRFAHQPGSTNRADHLFPATTGTVFNVGITGSGGPDLVVSANLTDGSGDYPGNGELYNRARG